MRLVLAALLLAGCVSGNVQQVRVAPLARYGDAKAVRVEAEPSANPDVDRALAENAARALAYQTRLASSDPAAPAFQLKLRVTSLVAPTAVAPPQKGSPEALLGKALSMNATPNGRLALEGTLFAPDGAPVGRILFDKKGDPAVDAPIAGIEVGQALGREMAAKADRWVARRAGDERLFLTPTPLTLEPGELTLNLEEVLLVHAGVGVHRRLQLDATVGGLPIPVAGAAPLFLIHVIGAAGGAAVAIGGLADVGLKLRLLDETDVLPGLSVGYDFLDLFGVVLGAGGLVLAGSGVGAAAVGAVGAVNVQFNAFNVAVGKHFGDGYVTAGTYVVDNHHLVPQSAGFAVGAVGSAQGSGDPSTGGGGAGGSTTIDRLPTQVQPFLAGQYVLGPHSALGLELLPRWPFEQTFATTGVKWNLGFDAPKGKIQADRIRFRIDLAVVWLYLPPNPNPLNLPEDQLAKDRRTYGLILPTLPYLGLGVYWL